MFYLLFHPLNFFPCLSLGCPLRALDNFFDLQLLSIIHDFGLTKLTPSLSQSFEMESILGLG